MAADWRRWILRDVARALPCQHFEIKLVRQPRNGTYGRCIKTVLLPPDEFIGHDAQIGRWSAQRLNVFMRPVGGPSHVLLDLDTPETLDEVLNLMASDGIVPSLVVETSPGHAQLWCSLPGREQPVEVHRAASKLLAERYGGDPGSAKPTQPGRVPGTMNPKPSRAMSDGTPPLVMILTSGEGYGTKFQPKFRPSKRLLADARLRAQRDAEGHAETERMRVDVQPLHADDLTYVGAMLAEAVELNGGDRSQADFAVSCVMLRAGDGPAHVAAILMATSEKAIEREARHAGAGERYIERTVQSAMRVVGFKPTEKGEAPSSRMMH
jgi:hypothetical protein